MQSWLSCSCDEAADGAEIVAEMEVAGRLDAGKDERFEGRHFGIPRGLWRAVSRAAKFAAGYGRAKAADQVPSTGGEAARRPTLRRIMPIIGAADAEGDDEIDQAAPAASSAPSGDRLLRRAARLQRGTAPAGARRNARQPPSPLRRSPGAGCASASGTSRPQWPRRTSTPSSIDALTQPATAEATAMPGAPDRREQRQRRATR